MTNYKEDPFTRKKFRNWITFAVVLAMVLSLAVGVSATSKPAGIYVLVHGTSSQSEANINLVSTTSWVDKNPDSAFFQISGEYTNGIISISNSSDTGARGLRSFSTSLPVHFTIEATPTYYYVSHCIQGGTQAKTGYATYTEGRLRL